jgi:hypothetical protein
MASRPVNRLASDSVRTQVPAGSEAESEICPMDLNAEADGNLSRTGI